jgi:hypothetical protein
VAVDPRDPRFSRENPNNTGDAPPRRADRQPCPLCRRRLGEVVCDPCRAHLARQLAAIPTLLAQVRADAAARADATDSPGWDPISRDLPAGPVPAGPRGPISRHSGLAHSPAPHAAVVIDDEPARIEPAAYLDLVDRWVPPGDPDPAGWLAKHLDDVASERLVDLAHDIAAAVLALRVRAGDPRQLVGHCPVEDCGGEIRAEPRAKTATCDECGSTWPRRHWAWLADTLHGA